MIKRFWRDQRGATAIEYGLIAALIFLAAVTGITAYTDGIGAKYKYISDSVDDATNPPD